MNEHKSYNSFWEAVAGVQQQPNDDELRVTDETRLLKSGLISVLRKHVVGVQIPLPRPERERRCSMGQEPLTIIFSNSKSYNPIVLWLCKLLNHTATHVAFGIQRDGQPYVFHMSSAKGATLTPREKFVAKNNIVKEYLFVDDLSDQVQKHLKYLGTQYNHTSALIHIIALVFSPLKYLLIYCKIRNEFYCSNFVRQFDQAQKIKAWRRISRYWASVDELLEACENNLEFVEVT